ncbi:MAG: tRNA pseudouridine(55) synthase TruB [Oscillatoriales cyanobacterium]|nr:MAG: tRNA pseudouridine(55) synthase TruB [Oscillatoriales cyanobacterium]
MDGFLNLYKSRDWTSHDCVAKVRRILQQKKVGHGGTLDPMATGVLPIALGRATRLIQYLPGDKAYTATVRFGLTTTTDDIEGEILTTRSASTLTRDAAIAAIPAFLGTIQQIPPKYSAIQIDGKRLYDLARSGIEVDVPVRTVTVTAIDVGAWRDGDQPELDLTIACGAGTYIRSIARDLGEAVGTGATLAKLERIRSSGLDLSSSVSLDDLATFTATDAFTPIAPQVALAGLPKITIDGDIAQRWRLGQTVTIDLPLSPDTAPTPPNPETSQATGSHDQIVWVADVADTFLGIGRVLRSEGSQETRLAPKMVYRPA